MLFGKQGDFLEQWRRGRAFAHKRLSPTCEHKESYFAAVTNADQDAGKPKKNILI